MKVPILQIDSHSHCLNIAKLKKTHHRDACYGLHSLHVLNLNSHCYAEITNLSCIHLICFARPEFFFHLAVAVVRIDAGLSFAIAKSHSHRK